ncbi:MAG: hypothetical protein IPG91_14270 [Ideonella sp.]|nr:hypothetical protein [Ideonella sp.]
MQYAVNQARAQDRAADRQAVPSVISAGWSTAAFTLPSTRIRRICRDQLAIEGLADLRGVEAGDARCGRVALGDAAARVSIPLSPDQHGLDRQ